MNPIQKAYRVGMERAVKEASEELAKTLGQDKTAISEDLMGRLGMQEQPSGGSMSGGDIAALLGSATIGGGGEMLRREGSRLGELQSQLMRYAQTQRSKDVARGMEQHIPGLLRTEGQGLGRLTSHISPQMMESAGKLLRGAGIAGGVGLAGKKLYDVLSD